MKQSDELTAFYQAYWDWVKAGALSDGETSSKNVYGFYRGTGLCANLRYFCNAHNCFGGYTQFDDEMVSHFIEAGLHCRTPFNQSMPDVYLEAKDDSAYLNRKRMQWVIDHCEPKE